MLSIKKRKNRTIKFRHVGGSRGGSFRCTQPDCKKLILLLQGGDTYYTRKNGQPGTMCANCASRIIEEYIDLFGNDGAMTGAIALDYGVPERGGWNRNVVPMSDAEREARAQAAAEKEERRRVLWEEGRKERNRKRKVAEADGSTKSG